MPFQRQAVPRSRAAMVTEVVRGWALRHGASTGQAGEPWRVRGDVIAAIERVDWMWRSGEWFAWWRAAAARLEEIAAAP
ncbi:hypothetical protein [Streptosporangium canum]|uniref:hypothetical protein n=1 Tax=Streptosporangium canum TaxID=324952 RepID=UPI00378E7030